MRGSLLVFASYRIFKVHFPRGVAVLAVVHVPSVERVVLVWRHRVGIVREYANKVWRARLCWSFARVIFTRSLSTNCFFVVGDAVENDAFSVEIRISVHKR